MNKIICIVFITLLTISSFSVSATTLNNPPTTPEINGPSTGNPYKFYEFSFIATDPDGDNIYYNVSWNCCVNEWRLYGPFPSGQKVILKNSWSEQGPHTITAKAIDIFGAESEYGTLDFTIPKNKITTDFFIQRFLQNHIFIYQFLQKLLNNLV